MEDRLAERVRREASARGLSVSAFVAQALADAVTAEPFRLVTAGGDGPLPAVNLDRPREIESREDESRYG